MTRKTIATIAGAFAAGVFIAAAPNALGHGPGLDTERAPMMACDEDEMSEHMSGADGHMSGGHMLGATGGWMTDMMRGAGGMR
ncbi:MAG TPA: hypothetical protein VK831_06670 [Candidatus Deferrimicrobiaceae bacterium]|nr:hypothetical protein [Candidatus Deferrimicrobiaceae bacterium]